MVEVIIFLCSLLNLAPVLEAEFDLLELLNRLSQVHHLLRLHFEFGALLLLNFLLFLQSMLLLLLERPSLHIVLRLQEIPQVMLNKFLRTLP